MGEQQLSGLPEALAVQEEAGAVAEVVEVVEVVAVMKEQQQLGLSFFLAVPPQRKRRNQRRLWIVVAGQEREEGNMKC